MLWAKVTFKGIVPKERHSAAMTALNDKIYLHGGTKSGEILDEFWVLDTNAWTWNSVTVKSKEKPTALWGHTLTTFKNKIFLFGGQDIERTHATLWIFDTESLMWSKPDQSGPPPSPRSYHASTVYGNRLLIFGGAEKDNNLYVLNTDTMEWNRPECTGFGPDARKETSIAVYQKKLIVFGGVSFSGMETLNELHILDFASKVWTKQVPRGAIPERRCGHIAVLVGKTLVVYGGRAGGNKGSFEDIHFTSADDISWAKTKGTGYKPEARANHSATLWNNKIFIFGGEGVKALTNEALLLEV